ncbi:MAG: beta-lactamase family protein [Chloroflexota bacterium]|nr:beta-lactamase family protein [Chloroflexota bacterium]
MPRAFLACRFPLALALCLSLPLSVAAQATPDSASVPLLPVSSPEAQGMDAALLAEADRVIQTELPDATGLVVVRNGAIVFERSYGDFAPDDAVKIRSVTKSVISALVGIAVADGLLSLDQTLGALIPERIPPGADLRAADITVESLLTMTSGLTWELGTDYSRIIASDDWVALTLSQPIVAAPGEVYVYNSGGSHLLSVILAEVTGQDTADYAKERLFDPLGIEPGAWLHSPQGEAGGGFGLELTPRDLATFGQLYLNGGVWEGEQLVPAEYVAASTTVQSAGDATGGTPYGYQWWVTGVYGYDAYFALGFGGQYLYVVPALNLVVVVVAGFETRPPVLLSPRYVIEGLIVPAAFGT